MKSSNLRNIAKDVLELEILALKKLRKSINKTFEDAVNAIVNCKSKVIVCGVGKSYLIASKVSSTMSSVGCASFSINANECSHGDLGSMTRKDVLIIISNSGKTEELKPVIQYANRNKINLIGITSKKNSLLYNASDIKLLIPEVKEAGLSIVPTSSTTEQIALGDCLAIAALNKKKFSKKHYKLLHPHGSIGNQLKTAEDLMISKNGIPFIDETKNMKTAINLITKKKLGILIAINKKKLTTGIITDGQLRRTNQQNKNILNLKVKDVMTRNPLSVNKDTLAAKSLSIMSENKITSLCVHKNKNKKRTIGILHIHHILNANIQ
tara:strand:- start:1370 stop:2341 length:972 start_codon:yes stop_codon:yes gene_type:complete